MNKKIIITFYLLVGFCMAYGQESTYFDAEGNITTDKSTAIEYSITEKSAVKKDSLFKVIHYYISGQKKSEETCLKEYRNGKITKVSNIGDKLVWFENGNVLLKAYYEDGKLNGPFITYWLNGTLKRNDSYKKGKLIDYNCFDSLGNRLSEYYPYYVYPEYPGGPKALNSFLTRTVRYPNKAKSLNIEGKVVLQFCIEVDGSVNGIKLIEESAYFNDEAIRVVKAMPKWIPGEIDGEKVRSYFKVPINFTLN